MALNTTDYGINTNYLQHLINNNLVEGDVIHGYWVGPIVGLSGTAVCKHSWIELMDGSVVDDTRWRIEDKSIYVYAGEPDYYDATGEKARSILGIDCPPFNPHEKIDFYVSDDMQKLLDKYLGKPYYVNVDHLKWLASKLSGVMLEDFIRACTDNDYGYLVENKLHEIEKNDKRTRRNSNKRISTKSNR